MRPDVWYILARYWSISAYILAGVASISIAATYEISGGKILST
jgi:hypothetical protein